MYVCIGAPLYTRVHGHEFEYYACLQNGIGSVKQDMATDSVAIGGQSNVCMVFLVCVSLGFPSLASQPNVSFAKTSDFLVFSGISGFSGLCESWFPLAGSPAAGSFAKTLCFAVSLVFLVCVSLCFPRWGPSRRFNQDSHRPEIIEVR